MEKSAGYRSRRTPSMPLYSVRVPASITSTMVERMHTLASPTAFCFMRYSRPETAVKCRGW